MINIGEILQTIEMIDQQNLDIRTITMGISLRDCSHPDIKKSCDKIYDKITTLAGRLVETGEEIEREFGIPIVNKRISVTPLALVAESSDGDDFVPCSCSERAAKRLELILLRLFRPCPQGIYQRRQETHSSIPEALARTERVCSVNVANQSGDQYGCGQAYGETILKCAHATSEAGGIACANWWFLQTRG